MTRRCGRPTSRGLPCRQHVSEGASACRFHAAADDPDAPPPRVSDADARLAWLFAVVTRRIAGGAPARDLAALVKSAQQIGAAWDAAHPPVVTTRTPLDDVADALAEVLGR